MAGLLAEQGFEIIDRNWKTKVCEIDIIAEKDHTIYFIEVKFRGSQSQGDGYEYITPKKLQRMLFAAQLWCQKYDWEDDYRLMAASVSGSDCERIGLAEVD